MDKQDFQEQDFMEILMRLPCPREENTLSLREEYFIPARVIISLREGKDFCYHITKVIHCRFLCNGRARKRNPTYN